ncbi:PREDICTED: tripartite motif-containing protein 65 [Nanorana parkeri]|uniref:tripartite motif-containing protein 65 n=1 Tax=Nanorana parkeri TaxID=125878 RepID=UPI00085421FC|nr:PREDICTED: tripartite motif-containing protein 65 [Nanorana parkeri]
MSESLKENLKNSLSCSICLELFTNPLTLSCGHTFCQTCIHGHWDSLQPQQDIFCPECRVVFPQRPEPQKNVSLHNVLEDLKKLEIKKVLLVPMLTESGPKGARTVCQEHNQELTFYCLTEKRCICCKCLAKSCRGHNFEDLEEQSEKEKKKLSRDFEANGHKKENVEKELDEWKGKSQNIKDFHDTLVSRMVTKFDQVRKTLEECQTLVVESVRCKEKAALAQVSDHLQLLQQHLQDLNKYHVEAEQLLDACTSDAELLEGLLLLAPVGCAPIPPDVQLCETVQMDAVTRVLPEVTRLLQEELPNALHPVAAQPEISGKRSSFGITEPCCPTQTSRSFPVKLKTELIPDPTTMSSIRAQLYQDYRNLMFDPETANRYIEISHENCKATHKTSLRRNIVPESPKRFKTWQVMCMEGFLEGSHYWEVEISTFFAQIGVAYGSLKRTKEIENGIGRNSHSWSLELRSMSQSVWHNNKDILLKAPVYNRIGVHLDCGAGSITFYSIKDGGLQILHTFHNVFSEKLYPVFWLGEDVNVKLHHVQNNPEGNVTK